MKPTVLILFPSEWVAYSPTIINLVSVLEKNFDVTVTAFDNSKYDNSNLSIKQFKIIRLPYLVFAFLAAIRTYDAFKKKVLEFYAKRSNADIIIGVDNIGIAAALHASPYSHFLSLELSRDSVFSRINFNQVKSIAIQSQERFDYLFSGTKLRDYFFLPNSPILNGKIIKKTRKKLRSEFKVVMLGNLTPSHGLYHCVEAVSRIEKASLTLKGPISKKNLTDLRIKYNKMINKGSLIVDLNYTPQNAILEYLSDFEIGFCFYDFTRINADDFNYESSPSGKMYAYFAAGIPVIGSDVIGLRPINVFSAGILLRDLSPKTICNAMDMVLKHRDLYQKGCVRAALFYDFFIHAEKYSNHLLESLDKK